MTRKGAGTGTGTGAVPPAPPRGGQGGRIFLFLFLSLSLYADDWPMFGGRPDRNMVSPEKGLPEKWGEDDVKWAAALGNETLGNPVIAGGRVFIGTNNGVPRDRAVQGDKGVLMCFSEKTGDFLWQAVHDKSPAGEKEDWKGIGICSTPCVVGDRVYYVSNRAELVCREAANGKPVWLLDMKKDLGAIPHQASASSPLVVDGLVFVNTGHGRDGETGKVKNPGAPSFIAVDAATGKVVWKDASPGEKILAGQWSSAAYGVVDGKPQVCFPGGDGWLYAFESATGKLLWKLNGKGHEKPKPDGTPETPNHYVATPVYAGHQVLIASGADPEGGNTPGCLRAVDARTGAELWSRAGEAFSCSISSVAVLDGLVYACDLAGVLNCLELETGMPVWSHDLLSGIWGSPMAADGKIYLRNEDGEVIVMKAGREKKLLATNKLPGLVHGTVTPANGKLYVAGGTKLYAIGK
jgi:outer membrane protein assembly factor BamB